MPSNIFSQGLGTKSSKTVAQNIITKTPAAARLKLSTAQANSTNSPSTMSSLESVLASDVAAVSMEHSIDGGAPGVNKKKQKRRQKQAARLAAEQPSPRKLIFSRDQSKENDVNYQVNHQISDARAKVQANGFDHGTLEYANSRQYESVEGDDLYYTDEEGREHQHKDGFGVNQINGHGSDGHPIEIGSKPKKKRKSSTNSGPTNEFESTRILPSTLSPIHRHAQVSHPLQPPLSTTALHSTRHTSKDRIWNTSTAEERERIREFWLSLNEEDRRSLVKVEKEAVLRKMKEQQKHSCSCTVCGRKRTAIEEELEVLYDAYYEELEQYANNQHISLEDGTPIIPHPRLYAHPMARMPPSRNPHTLNGHRPSSGRIQELDEDEEGDDEDYSDEDEEDDLSEEEPDEIPPGPAADFFNFGNSLTVQGGILTVADDLLKNDGKKFIEMMEQLAERRMRREEDAQYASVGLGHPSTQSHNHGPPLDDDGYEEEEEDDEEYDSQDDEEYDDEESETLTEEQRMEEGRRMFQIFAARMFEQRVLTAYREKVASERQQKLIEELDEESRLDTQREAKKAKEAQKKKEKKRQQKQVKDEEKAKREAEKAAEEAEAKALIERKVEEQRQKKEEQRKKKEAEKKAQDEERQRKEAEKQKRLQEAREQQAEIERKQREQKERDKKQRAETKQREREEREVKENEAQKEKVREAAKRKEREALAKNEREKQERSRKEAQEVKPKGQAVPPHFKHVAPSPIVVPISTLQPPQTGSAHASPHLQVATPVIPKAPTPIRPRKASYQGSQNSSPKTSQVPSGSSTTSPSLTSLPQNGFHSVGIKPTGLSSLQHPSAITMTTPLNTSPIVSQPPGFSGAPVMVGNTFPLSQGSMLPPMTSRTAIPDPIHYAQLPPNSHQQQFNVNNHFRFANPNGLPFPPGINGMRPLPHGRGALDMSDQIQPLSKTMGSINVGQYMSRDMMPTHSHSRHTSASFTSFDVSDNPGQTQPIARPTPIQRPSSVAPNQLSRDSSSIANVDDLSNHLGSSALLDDTDIPLSSNSNNARRGSMAPGMPLATRHGFNAGGGKLDPFLRGMPNSSGNNWNSQAMPFGPPGVSSPPPWSPAPSWSNFGVIGGPNRPSASRAVVIRQLVCQACHKLSVNPSPNSRNGFHSVDAVLRQVELLKSGHEGSIFLRELLDICDTEGNSQNGGGSFIVEKHEPNGLYIKFEPGHDRSVGARGAAGEIGSPMTSFYAPGVRMAQPPVGGVLSPSGF